MTWCCSQAPPMSMLVQERGIAEVGWVRSEKIVVVGPVPGLGGRFSV